MLDMLSNSPVYANIPVQDIARAQKFYAEALGLKVENVPMPGIALLSAGDGTKVLLYQRPPSHAEHTLASFTVKDIVAEIKNLTEKGIKFEQYDMGDGYKTDAMGVMTAGPAKTAWFKDSEGNILGLNQQV